MHSTVSEVKNKEGATEEVAAWPTYPTAACARGVVADTRIVRVVRATAGTPLIAVDEGHVASVQISAARFRPAGWRGKAVEGGARFRTAGWRGKASPSRF